MRNIGWLCYGVIAMPFCISAAFQRQLSRSAILPLDNSEMPIYTHRNRYRNRLRYRLLPTIEQGTTAVEGEGLLPHMR
jgi:hypothetical protein